MTVKRIFDIIFSLVFLCVLFPFFLLISLVIKLDSKGPAIFTQKRYGKGQKPFNILKFRTMYIDAPDECSAYDMKCDQRYITRVGKFLRKTSIDEVIQLVNILLGEMSFVGPRPVLLKEADLIAERELYKANDVRPGLTGWAQINGRNELSVEEKARFDGEYVKRMNFFFDLSIIFRTIPFVIKKRGIVVTEYNTEREEPAEFKSFEITQ